MRIPWRQILKVINSLSSWHDSQNIFYLNPDFKIIHSYTQMDGSKLFIVLALSHRRKFLKHFLHLPTRHMPCQYLLPFSTNFILRHPHLTVTSCSNSWNGICNRIFQDMNSNSDIYNEPRGCTLHNNKSQIPFDIHTYIPKVYGQM